MYTVEGIGGENKVEGGVRDMHFKRVLEPQKTRETKERKKQNQDGDDNRNKRRSMCVLFLFFFACLEEESDVCLAWPAETDTTPIVL